MTEEELKGRCKQMALRVIRLVMSLPKNNVADVLGKQLVRSATSVAQTIDQPAKHDQKQISCQSSEL